MLVTAGKNSVQQGREVYILLMPESYPQSLVELIWVAARFFLKSSPSDFNVQPRLRITVRGGKNARRASVLEPRPTVAEK